MDNFQFKIDADELSTSKTLCVGEMASSLSYLLETELSKIAAHVSRMSQLLDEESLDRIHINEELHQLTKNIEKLSIISRELKLFMNHNDQEVAAKTNLKNLIEKALQLESERFRSHGVKIVSSIEDPLYIFAKESQLSQIILSALNSAYNSVHRDRDAWVKIQARSCDQKIFIEISDSQNAKCIKNLKLFKILEFLAQENNGSFIFDPTSDEAIYRVIIPQYHS